MNLSDHSEHRQSAESHANHLSSDVLRFIRTALIGLILSGGCATTISAAPSTVTPVQKSEQSNPDDDDKNDEDDIYGEDYPCRLKNPDSKGACPLVQKVDKRVSRMVAADEKGAGHIF